MQIRQTFWVEVEGDLAYDVRAMLYIADLPRDLGVTNPFSRPIKVFAVFGTIDAIGVFERPVALLYNVESCLSADGTTLLGLDPMYDFASSAGVAVSSKT